MTILDTDHLTVVLNRDHSDHTVLTERLQLLEQGELAITVIRIEEQVRGWLARINQNHGCRKTGVTL